MTILMNFGLYDEMIRALINVVHSIATNNYIEVYKGIMPADANDWTSAGSSADLLVTFNNFKLTQTITQGDVQAMIFSQTPNNPVNATATGTAAWYAMFSDGVGNKGPILGDVTVFGGTGTLQLDSVAITSGNPVTIKHWGIRLQN